VRMEHVVPACVRVHVCVGVRSVECIVFHVRVDWLVFTVALAFMAICCCVILIYKFITRH
jgi:hypothetical protein